MPKADVHEGAHDRSLAQRPDALDAARVNVTLVLGPFEVVNLLVMRVVLLEFKMVFQLVCEDCFGFVLYSAGDEGMEFGGEDV